MAVIQLSTGGGRKEFVGLSGDTKPTDSSVPAGSLFYERDTQTFYQFDGSAWFEYNIAGGGGSSSSSGVVSGPVTVTRPANTTAYAAGDVVGGVITFPNFDVGEYMLTSASMYRGASAVETGEGAYTLHLYNITPPSALADNAVWDVSSANQDREEYLGAIPLGAIVDLGGTIRLDIDGINKQVTSLSSNLFGYLVTEAAYTPQSATSLFITLHAIKV